MRNRADYREFATVRRRRQLEAIIFRLERTEAAPEAGEIGIFLKLCLPKKWRLIKIASRGRRACRGMACAPRVASGAEG